MYFAMYLFGQISTFKVKSYTEIFKFPIEIKELPVEIRLDFNNTHIGFEISNPIKKLHAV